MFLNEIRDSVRRVVSAGPLAPDRADAWRTTAELGWLLVSVPEARGGLGLSLEQSAEVHYEVGGALWTAPLFSSLFAAYAASASDRLAREPSREACFARGGCAASSLTHAKADFDGGCLNGLLTAVTDADIAERLLVFGDGVFAFIDLGAEGVETIPRDTWDETRKLFDVRLTDVKIKEESVIAVQDAANHMAVEYESALLLALAADSLGGANTVLAMTVEYLKTRMQFGRPLAMFQALKHRCADLKIRHRAAEALLWSYAQDQEAGRVDYGGLKALCCDLYEEICQEAIQLHGGIAVTEEYDCHRFLKRATLNSQLGGLSDHWDALVGSEKLSAFSDAGSSHLRVSPALLSRNQ